MKDIVPYTPAEAESLGSTLTKMGIPSFGPETGMQLLRVVEGVEKLMKDQRLDSHMVDVLKGFQQRILDVCEVAAGQQKEAIAHFERLTKRLK